MTIVLRQDKGSELDFTELDGNISTLDSRTKLGWRDNIVQMVPRGGVTEPPLIQFRDGIYLMAFSQFDNMEAFGHFHIDHDYSLGTALYPHIHWTVNSSSVGTVRWGFEYSFAKGHQQAAFGPTTTIYVEQTTDGTAYKHYVAEVSDADAIPGTGIEPDTIIMCRVFRDAISTADNYDGAAFGICLDLHYQADKLTTINKRPNFYGV